MRVDGIPNVRICRVPVQSGMRVESQNAWPSLNFDIAAVSGFLDFLVRPGFQYRRFIRPRWLYHIWERFLSRMAGIGTLADIEEHTPPRRLTAEPDVAVIGGGIAGLSAALHATEAGAQVWLIEREDLAGGRILYDTAQYELPDSRDRRYGLEIAADLTNAISQLDSCRMLTAATAIAWYDEGIVAVVREGELWELSPKRTVVATGSYENPMVFENNDLPGIFLAGGLQRLMHRDFVRPGNTAVVVTHSDRGYALAHQLVDAGVAVAAIADNRADEQALNSKGAQKARGAAISIHSNFDIEAALGRRHVKGVRLRPTDGSNRPKLILDCDILCIAGSRIPANELVFQRTSQGQYILESPHQFTRKPLTSSHMRIEDDLYVAGGAAGSQNLKQSWLEGKVAGLSAALDLGYGNAEAESIRNDTEALLNDFP